MADNTTNENDKLKSELDAIIGNYGTSLENQIKSVNKLTAQFGKGTKSADNLKASLEAFKDVIDDADDELRRLTQAQQEAEEQAEKEAAGSKERIILDQKVKKITTEILKIEHNQAIALKNHTEALKEATNATLTSGFASLLLAIPKIAMDAVANTAKMAQTAIDGLQTSKNSIQIANDVYVAEIERLEKAVNAGSAAVGDFGKAVPGVGAAFEIAGGAAKLASSATFTLTKDGIKTLNTELLKTKEQFNKANNAGAYFVGGMSLMRESAGDAGLRLDEYVSVLSKASGSLRLFGESQAGAMRKVSEVLVEMPNGMKESLRKLGYTQEDIAEGSAEYLATLASTGRLAGRDNGLLAKETGSYLTNLKLISAITGEDAKAAKSRAEDASRQAAVYNELSDVGGAAKSKFEGLVKLLGPGFEKSIQQAFVGGPITDPSVALGPVKAIIEEGARLVRDGSVTQEEATRIIQTRINEQAGAIKAFSKDLNAAALAELYGMANETGAGMSKYGNLINQSSKDANTILDEMKNQSKTLAQGGDKLTDTVTALDTQIDTAAKLLEKELTPGLDGFAKQIKSSMADVEKYVNLKLAAMVSEKGAGPAAAISAVTENIEIPNIPIYKQFMEIRKKAHDASWGKVSPEKIETDAETSRLAKKAPAPESNNPGVLSSIGKAFSDMFGGTGKPSERDTVKPVDKKVEPAAAKQPVAPVPESKPKVETPKANEPTKKNSEPDTVKVDKEATVKVDPKSTTKVDSKPLTVEPTTVKVEEPVAAKLAKEKQPTPVVPKEEVVKPNAKLELPKDLFDAQHAADIKAAKEYAVSNEQDKALIRETTGLSDKQLTRIHKDFQEKAKVKDAAQPATQVVPADNQIGIPKSSKDLNLSATIPDSKAMTVDSRDSKVLAEILAVMKSKPNETTVTAAQPEINLTKLIAKFDEQNQLLRSQLDMDRQVLEKLDKANSISRDILSYAS